MGLFDKHKNIFDSIGHQEKPIETPVSALEESTAPAQETIAVHISRRAATSIKKPKKKTSYAESFGNDKHTQNVVTVLEKALEPFGERIKVYGAHFFRIRAVWRGSRDYNIAVHARTGAVRDHATSESYTFNQLLGLLDADPVDIVFDKFDKNDVTRSINRSITIANTVWSKGIALNKKSKEADIGIKYLMNRGIPLEVIQKIGGLLRVTKDHQSENFILMSPIYQPKKNGTLMGIQRTYINEDGHKTYIVKDGEVDSDLNTKAMLGSHIAAGFNFDKDSAGGLLLHGDRERFFKNELAVVEGLETGLSVLAATGMPVYVMYDTAGIMALDINYIKELGVKSLVIAADNDDADKRNKRRAGLYAANALATRAVVEYDLPTKIAMPSRKLTEGKACDWNNIWNLDKVTCGEQLLNGIPFVPKKEGKPVVKSILSNVYKKKD